MTTERENAILAFPNWLQPDPAFATVTTTGGVWLPELPFANALTSVSSEVARSADANPQHTKRWISLGTTRDVRLIALPDLVSGENCQIKFTCYETWLDEESTVLGTTGWKDRYDVVYPEGTLPSWHQSFVTGKLTAEERSLYPIPWFHWFEDAAVIGENWLMEIDDSGSDIGYVDIPYIHMAPGHQPTVNINDDATLDYDDPSIVQQSHGGQEYIEELDGRRVWTFEIVSLPEDEAWVLGLDAQVRLGKRIPVFISLDPSDTSNRHRISMLARLRKPPPVKLAAAGLSNIAFEAVEVL